MNIIGVNKKICVCFITIIIAFSVILPVHADDSERQIVKVAYFNIGDYYKEVSDEIVDSYDTEVLTKIERYSNLTFKYVDCGTWEHALEMLNQHEVDLVGTFQWTRERETQYEFCLQGYGYTVGEIVALPDKSYIYEDYDTIKNSVIGCIENYVRRGELEQLFQEKNISPKMKYYDSQSELENAIETGEVDLIVANSHVLKNTYETVEKFTFSPFFFASWKGNNQLTDQVDDAIIKMNIQEPGADDEMMEKYFPSIIGEPLSKEERNLINENKIYDVYFDANTKPLSWYDEETGTMKGGLVEVCRQISQNTGLKLNPVPMIAGETKLDDTSIRTTTVYEGVDGKILSKPGETKSFLDESFNMYYRDDKVIDLKKDSFSVGIVINRVHLKDYICNKYPNAIIKEYANPTECLKAVESGDSDLTYLDCRIADNRITEDGIENIREFPIEQQYQSIALIFPEENSDLLISIVNKGLDHVNYDVVSDLFIQSALNTDKPVTIQTIIQDYFIWFVIAGFVFLLFIAVFVILFTYTRVMKKQKDKIVKVDAERTEFFGRMSHDMRTPMNGILGMIELSETSDNMDEIRDNLNKAKSSGKYMLSLINDTLDLQRMESKKLKLEKDIIHVSEYFNEIFSVMKVSADKKALDFSIKYIDINMDDYLEIDSVRVKQILVNIISNAIKYTPDEGAVEIIIESLGQDGEILHTKFQVRDTGVGMSEDFIKNRLFKPYSQENNKLSKELTGSGLGMAITKNLVNIMGGRLEVDSILGEGTTFTTYLDVKLVSKEQAEKASKKSSAESKIMYTQLEGKRILLCEDHPLNAEIAKKLLEKVGCIVEWTENGKIGVERFEQSEDYQFDAILMDIRMPVMDGLQAAKAIRNLSKADAKTIPIIAMTANAYESDINNCLESGMNMHLPKPIEPQMLYQALCNFVIH